MAKYFVLLMVLIAACDHKRTHVVATFESKDIANKVVVMLNSNDIHAELSNKKDLFIISVEEDQVMKARILLSAYNFYFEKEDLNVLLESKFASLSKLEAIKSNLLESKEISNTLNLIPDVLRADVLVHGMKEKHISVLIVSIAELEESIKNSINTFLNGIISQDDFLTISYLVREYKYDTP